MDKYDDLKNILGSIDGPLYANIHMEGVIKEKIERQLHIKSEIQKYKRWTLIGLVGLLIMIVIIFGTHFFSEKVVSDGLNFINYSVVLLILLTFFIQIELGAFKLILKQKNKL
ncbi:hypothetical protein [Winogradskyella flava]|uniref:hypothetical protein n=1 Tax=Winogradskyella flava TaxID=1884876 RepID=UPI00249219FF|nr:hypothetical protein [Winogradskyella flava]